MANFTIPEVRGPMGLTLQEAEARLAENSFGRVKTMNVRKKIARLEKEIAAIRYLSADDVNTARKNSEA